MITLVVYNVYIPVYSIKYSITSLYLSLILLFCFALYSTQLNPALYCIVFFFGFYNASIILCNILLVTAL